MEFSARTASYVLGIFFAAFLIKIVTLYKFEGLQNYTVSQDVVSIKQVEKNLNCMALNIYREAGHEPFEGKVGVAQVTMNRVAHSQFPNEICDVVYQKNVVMSRVVCQFSWYCDTNHRNRPINKEAYKESYEVAKKVILEGFRLDVLNDALYYHADYVSPNWRLDKVGKIGTHIFYKERSNDRI
jgi:spore germination cell wall hydrolase CwlJ-like protein